MFHKQPNLTLVVGGSSSSVFHLCPCKVKAIQKVKHTYTVQGLKKSMSPIQEQQRSRPLGERKRLCFKTLSDRARSQIHTGRIQCNK